MPARNKLNSAFFNGSFIVAGLIGWLAQSWVVFVVAALVLIGTGIHSGDIRKGKRR